MRLCIDKFSGEYTFLSNFYHSSFSYQGEVWPTLEHAYQAAKSNNLFYKSQILEASSPGEAKRLGRSCRLREDWEEKKIEVMKELLRLKFSSWPLLEDRLLATGDLELIEGNTWGDTFWGVYKGVGKNWLGKLLMEIRKEIVDGRAERGAA